jgi:plasmid maintenance system antidote protein VapI
MNMQARFDLERTEDELGAELRKIVAARDVKSAA